MESPPIAPRPGAQDAALAAASPRHGIWRYGEALLVAVLLLSFVVRGALTARGIGAYGTKKRDSAIPRAVGKTMTEDVFERCSQQTVMGLVSLRSCRLT